MVLEAPADHMFVVLPIRVAEPSQTPVGEPPLPYLMVSHDGVQLDMPVHLAVGVTIVQHIEQFRVVYRLSQRERLGYRTLKLVLANFSKMREAVLL